MSIDALLKRSLFWTKDFLKGAPVRHHYHDISQILAGGETAERRRKEYLHSILKFAISECAFYRNCNSEDLLSFPIVDKNILRMNAALIHVPIERIPDQEGAFYIQKTSGSTGTPFALPQDSNKRQRCVAELKYFGELVGFRSHDRLIHLRIWNRYQHNTSNQMFWENINPFDSSYASEERLRELCELANNYKAIAVRGYASYLDRWGRYALQNGYKFPTLKVVFAISEQLLISTRELFEDQLGIRITSQYANQECGVMGYEKAEDDSHAYYLNHAGYYFEFLKLDSDLPAEEGEISRIVVTDLFNRASPMIRYDTGDTATYKKSTPLSGGFPVIEKLYGRRLDMVYTTQGIPVFPMALARTLKHYDSIIFQWQFIQKEKDEYLLKIIPNATISETEQRSLLQEMFSIFGQDANIQLEFTQEIPVLYSGKRKAVVCELKTNK